MSNLGSCDLQCGTVFHANQHIKHSEISFKKNKWPGRKLPVYFPLRLQTLPSTLKLQWVIQNISGMLFFTETLQIEFKMSILNMYIQVDKVDCNTKAVL